jgi:hypothetical protein
MVAPLEGEMMIVFGPIQWNISQSLDGVLQLEMTVSKPIQWNGSPSLGVLWFGFLGIN